MKSVLISIQPKWVDKIASGKKTIEVRKGKPNLATPFKCYIYCTKGLTFKDFKHSVNLQKNYNRQGKVIGEFVCDTIDDLRYVPTKYYLQPAGTWEEMICSNSCLSVDEIKKYAKGKAVYGWHISDLKIYDKPKELSEFWYIDCKNKKNGCVGCEYKPTCINNKVRPPQSWCYIESLGE